jgi:hypothetical protein
MVVVVGMVTVGTVMVEMEMEMVGLTLVEFNYPL